MSFSVIVTRDFDQMSEVAAEIVGREIAERTAGGSGFNLGLATGNTPTGLYKYLAKAANRGDFDAARVVSFNLDEYVGLPGENPQQRALHPESYTFFMIRELFGLLRTRFHKTYLPAGTLIDQEELDSALAGYPDDWEERGKDKGRAIVIGKEAASPCLSRIRRDVLDHYAAAIRAAGGIDLHIIGVGGYRIELGEIEACLNRHPGVKDAVVIAREDKPGDIRLVAYVRPSADRVPEASLREHAGAALPDYMVPAHFVSMAAFPLTPNAKIDRKALPKPGEALHAVAGPITFIAPTQDVEIRIAEAFRRALGVEKIGTLDNFFAMGGHSLLAVQVHRELKKSVASNLSITDLYRFPTVAGLAAHILDRGQASKDLDRVASRAAMRRNAIAARRPLQRT